MKLRIVILAAGKGTRMGQPFAKALTPVGGMPILGHLLETIQSSGLDPLPVVVIGHLGDQIRAAMGDRCAYVEQGDPLGTGHAVRMAAPFLMESDAVMVLYGDHPFISAESLRRIAKEHEEQGNTITLMTTTVPSFEGWHKAFLKWGRILRGADGAVTDIREYKDASENERNITEVNPALYCFESSWLWKHLHKLGNRNAQKEYYLTDLVAMAVAEGASLSTLPIPPEEAVGINTPEELAFAEGLVK
ncbi:NTP transferase domain-containing protein [Candidatus Uhrbacteria bacterium]|nr:NTP transferase domain-containing protein [Candidatus Uhrbacteria bacterium]